MPHQYGIPGFVQSPTSPASQHGALLPRILGGAVIPGGGGTSGGSAMNVYRQHIEEKKLSREAMERYIRDRNDMIILILHAKVNNIFY